MKPQPILILGPVRGNLLERVETARLLGLEAVCVLFDESPSHSSVETFTLEALPKRLKDAPCILGAPRLYSENTHKRLDKRWLVSNGSFVKELEELGFRNWLTLIHPSATVSESAVLGHGSFVGPQVSISSETKIGNFVSIGRGSSIGHDVVVGDFCSFGPGVTVPGKVEFGNFTLVGPAATFANGLRISEGALIGAGSVVTKHVRNGNQVMGNPARKLRRPVAIAKRLIRQNIVRALKMTGFYERARVLFKQLRG